MVPLTGEIVGRLWQPTRIEHGAIVAVDKSSDGISRKIG
jgi:hypothetical protein